jgi:hypothetical protein
MCHLQPISCQPQVSLVLAFGAPAACVAATSKFPAFVFIGFVVFFKAKEIQAWGCKDEIKIIKMGSDFLQLLQAILMRHPHYVSISMRNNSSFKKTVVLVENQGVNSTFIMGTSKVLFAVDFLLVTSQS